ncbi:MULTISPECIES: SDR family oxidoreductase [Anaerotruncus]|nr:SDR family oxidoreductase [Anaerotruncus massiliensis (ex Togo et al. 2019)]
MKLFDVNGKRAIVTGGSRGLGGAMAVGLMEHGCKVAVVAASPQTAERVAAFARPGWEYGCVAADLSRQEERERAFRESLELLDGRVDLLVNAAGIQRKHPCAEFPLPDWQEVLEVNLTATFAMCQLAGKRMLEQRRGKIVNIASMGSYIGSVNVPAYVASKGGVVQLTKALSNEWSGRGVCVNAIAPGYMHTDLTIFLMRDETRNREILSRIPMGRWGEPEDLIGTLLFLASAASDYVTGAVIPVDGGFLGR